MPHRSPPWIWTGRIMFVGLVATLVAYLYIVGLDKADKAAGSIAAVLALLSLGLPYLLPAPTSPPPAGVTPVVNAAGAGAVAVGADNRGQIDTDVSASTLPIKPLADNGVHAGGAGSVAIGGANSARIRTKVTGADPTNTTS